VARKDLARNTLIVVQEPDHPLLLSDEILTEPAHWVAGSPPPGATLRCAVKTRYRQADQACTVELRPDGRCVVRTDVAQRAVTPGQSAVFYDGPACLGGAVIAATSRQTSRVESARASGL
jgi:tRNA-specific 2-thiouridylase